MNKSQSKRKCSRCKRQGHTITTCYAKTDVKGNYIKSSSKKPDYWECEYCEKPFDTEKGCRFHENVHCKYKPKKNIVDSIQIEKQRRLKKQQEEMKRQQEIKRQQEEMKRQQEIKRQQEEMKRQQEEIKRQQEQQMKIREQETQFDLYRGFIPLEMVPYFYTQFGELIRDPHAYAMSWAPIYSHPQLMYYDINTKTYIYRCNLGNGRWYIGKTTDFDRRNWQHCHGQGSQCTMKFPPIEDCEIIDTVPGFISNEKEQEWVNYYIGLYGYDKVRGGKYINSKTFYGG